jgi:sn-glycerol 3-phosphate transport system substrate-binding protein
MRRLVLKALVMAALALQGAAAPAKTPIVFWHAMDAQTGEAVAELVNRFNRSQDEFEVQAVYRGGYAQLLSDAIAAYRAQRAPDLVQVYEVGTQSMLYSNAIVPMQRLLRQQKVKLDWSDIVEPISGYYAMNGRASSTPFNVSTPILYYNKALFRRAGLPEQAPATWQELESAARTLIHSGAATCGFTTAWLSWALLESTFAWHDQPFATNQNGYTGLDTKLLINGDFGRMHVGALARWRKEGTFGFTGRTGQTERFAAGECAMLFDSSASIGRFRQSLAFDWGAGPLPHWGPPYPRATSLLGGATLWALRGRSPEAYKGVAQFVRFIVQPSQQAWWAAATGYLPVTQAAVKKLQDEGNYQRDPEQWTAMSQLLESKPTPNSRGLRLGNYVQVREAIELELENIFDGRKSVQQGLDAAVSRGNAILRQFGVSHDAARQGEI